MKIRIVATGEYPKDLPESLARALEEEIAKHMQGYGLQDVRVQAIEWGLE